MDILIYKRKANSVQNKMNKDSSPTLIRVGMFFKNPYHHAESNRGTLFDFKLNDFFLAVWALGTKNIDSFLKKKKNIKWTNKDDKHSNYCKH